MGGTLLSSSIVALVLASACGGGNAPPREEQARPAGRRTTKTAALEAGAALVQSKSPVNNISLYMVGFHPSKSDPSVQIESHHYCDQVNRDFAQCVLYDDNGGDARLHGVEFIISEKLYKALPEDEKPYWHPHNYEILSGTLQMPGVPQDAAHEALREQINSYGKTWHFWKTGAHDTKADDLPLGPPHLAWSFNHDGEAKPGLVEERDRRMGLNTGAERSARASWASAARPQGGVDALAGMFPNARAIPGVRDNGDAATRPVPTVGIVEPGRRERR